MKQSKQSTPNKFQDQLIILKTELKDALAVEDKARVKELQKFIRNLEKIIARIEGLHK